MEKSIVGIIVIGLGLLFFFNNKKIGEGAAKFYQKLCTKHNLKIMFKACGVVLVFLGLVLIFLNN